MANGNDGPSYPKPFIMKPRKEHKQSLIILHGRGDIGEDFGRGLLCSQTSSGIFMSMFPDAKFIFPTALKRAGKWYNGAVISQWFDNVPIDEQDKGVTKDQEEWQLEGLRQSRAFLKSIVDDEVSLVGAGNVFIGGLSQGCAMAFHLLLSYEEPSPLGGFVGMSGWLPFADTIETILRPRNTREDRRNDNENVPSNQSQNSTVSPNIAVKVCNFVRDNMDLPPITSSQPSWLSTPVFLGHGNRDERVKLAKGLRAANYLRDCGVQVSWKEYDEGHWYKAPEEIDDIVEFLQASLSR